MDHQVIRVQSIQQLMEALSVRKKVFVSEQGIDQSKDIDGFDHTAVHLLIYDGEMPIATGRLLVNDREGHISRIAVIKSYRHQGLGRIILHHLEDIAKEEGLNYVYLNAHDYLKKYYENIGYITSHEGHFKIGRHQLIKMTKNF